MNEVEQYAAECAATNSLTLDEIGHLIVMAIYESEGNPKIAAETLERARIQLGSCELGPQVEEIFSGAIETLDNYRGFDL